MLHYLRYYFLLAVWILAGCVSLPSLDGRTISHYNDNLPKHTHRYTIPTPEALNGAPPAGKAWIYLLDSAADAFTARATLIETAQRSLDIQYYIWHNDASGKLLFNMLLRAADRGVRIRLLLDDNNTHGLDPILAFLNHHPNIEIRLFNPFTFRRMRALGYLTDFSRLNRRMHNKSLTADNQLSILGGRNIGDEYFNIADDTSFADLDILVKGNIVHEVAQDFDRYWASHSSYPAERIIKGNNITAGQQLLTLSSDHQAQLTEYYNHILADSPLQQALNAQHIPWEEVGITLVSDDPKKGLDQTRKPDIATTLQQTLHTPKDSVYLVSPYFVPTHAGTKALTDLATSGVNINILTNSLQATDVAAVHSGYAKYRKPLLKAGIHLYELKPNHAVPKSKDRGLTGSAATSLHAKTFIIDQKRLFIGSFNLDPRSAQLNTEMGVVINSPKVAQRLHRSLENTTPQYAYSVTLTPNHQLQWHDPENNRTLSAEPEANFWKRFTVKLLSLLPIEGLL